mgnify:CR=1 FL=1|jgi:uncharacterized membrane protein
MINWSTKLRPQILTAMFLIAGLGALGCYVGMQMSASEIVTGALGATVSLIGVLGMKVLESDE